MIGPLVLILVVGVAALNSHPVDPDLDFERLWKEHMIEYDLHYKTKEEENALKANFAKSMKYVHNHNVLYDQGLSGYKLKLTHYAPFLMDLPEMTLIPGNSIGLKFVSKMNAEDLPKEVDWRTKGIISKVGKQFECAACYAFTSAGAIESHAALKTGKLIPVSVQEIVDCTEQSCMGGLMTTTFEYFKNHEMHSEKSYPYVDHDQDCQFSNDSVVGKLSGYVEIEEGNEQHLMEAVATVGPVAVGINMGGDHYYLFGEGIYDNPTCKNDAGSIGHAILIVGYGSENGKDYWITKNSFGDKWGENGYMKISRNINQCGIALMASYPLL